jgi:hypothetical protein
MEKQNIVSWGTQNKVQGEGIQSEGGKNVMHVNIKEYVLPPFQNIVHISFS